ncbi:hemolysin family protein [Frisingicoccus sp.]|uniref:hemolysin family protein n=1 Tax=Frisingicoccus sp. TaxID=1918627 RepID=UPI0025C60431|nr:hemolysin family protein [Frisingicoccus sp.]MDD6155758.1 hemolysin family protein [Lachnospiraceae bacterium]MDD6231187.1 hemolysin family protein [Frisingicoccus sp.]MDY4835438.1 hemolysin family protein [Frisingicoccus sp.]
MDPTSVAQLITLIILIILSAFFSSAETAFTTVNKIRIRTFEEEGRPNAALIRKLTDDPQKMLSAILIGNNIVNLTASSLTTIMVTRITANLGLASKSATAIGIATGILTLIILVFGEITPKSIATRSSERICFFYIKPIYWMTVIFTPLIFIVNKISFGFMKLFGMRYTGKERVMTENELLTIIDVSHEEGVLESEEKEMINNVVDFGDSLAKDIMVPRIDMVSVPSAISYDDLKKTFKRDMYSRLPVYEESKDNVVGIVTLKDFFNYEGTKEDFKLSDLLREPYFTYEYQKTSDLLIQMRENSINISIVLDEYGSTAGIITLEDLIEEIVGEIRDEYDDDEEDPIQKLSTSEYLVDGSTRLDDINEVFGCNIESDDYDSIAGHMINVLEHIPCEGEEITEDYIRFVIDKMDKNRIDKIHVYLTTPEKDIQQKHK